MSSRLNGTLVNEQNKYIFIYGKDYNPRRDYASPFSSR